MFICPKCKGRATKTLNMYTGVMECQQCETTWIVPQRTNAKEQNHRHKLKK